MRRRYRGASLRTFANIRNLKHSRNLGGVAVVPSSPSIFLAFGAWETLLALLPMQELHVPRRRNPETEQQRRERVERINRQISEFISGEPQGRREPETEFSL